ncbi:MAG: helix-turn-helix domain-containing protein [Methanotrichaceae archaeon]
MGRILPVLAEEEAAILTALDAGLPVRQVAKQFNRSPSTISRVAARNDVELERSQTKKATEAAKAFNLTRRLETNNKAFIKFEDLLDRCDSATDLRNLAVAYGIIVDKRLLEDPGEGGQRGGEVLELVGEIRRRGGGR